jgi:1,4-alpha-glucan branching enzyme
MTFSMVYAYSENYVLPISHDEVVHGKRSLVSKMPGDRWQKFANLRSLYAYMWAHPGKKLLFMGQEFGQEQEWNEERSLDWHLLENREHAGVQSLVRDLNRVYKQHPAMWEVDFDGAGFYWLEPNDAENSVVAFARTSKDFLDIVACCLNLTPVPRPEYRIGLPRAGRWVECVNTDAEVYGGSNVGNMGGVVAEAVPWGGQPFSAKVTLPPLGGVWLVPADDEGATTAAP